jgi:nucleoside-diphosphate-sugar epimerase
LIFLLGGEGFVGSAYVRYFQLKNIKFKIINRLNYDDLIGSSCNLFINANGNSKKYFADKDPKLEFQYSVSSVKNSLIDFKFKKYIFLSSCDVYSDCSTPILTKEKLDLNIEKQSTYGFHKYLAELCVRNYAKKWLIIRQGGFVGIGLKKNAIFDLIYKKKIAIHPESEFQYINTDVSAELVMKLVHLNVWNQVFNITSKGTIKIKDIIKILNKKINFNKNICPVRYKISTKKVTDYLSLPSTVNTINSFLKSILNKK